MKNKLWLQLFYAFIIISIIVKSFQVLDRLFNVIILNLQLHGSGNYDKPVHFIFSEIKIEYWFSAIIYLLFVTAFSIWLYLKYKQANQTTNINLSYKPIWALFSFIIPIFNLIAPYRIMNDLWTVFNRDISIENEGKQLIKQWWFLSVSLFILNRFLSIHYKTVQDLNTFLNEEYCYLFLHAVSIHYYMLVRRLVNSIDM